MAGYQLRIKSGLLEGAQPFSIDFGGSTIKLVYLTPDSEDDQYKVARCEIFPRADFRKALDFIKKEVPLPSRDDHQPITHIMTGLGIQEFSKTIEEELHIRPVTVWEGGCFTEAIYFLMKHVSEDPIYYPTKYSKDESWQKYAAHFAAFIGATGSLPQREVTEEIRPRHWPFILVTLGSAVTYKEYREDGSMKDLHFSPRGGRMFLGLGALLTGAKTYEELITLAKEGDDRSVHSYSSDLMKSFEEKDDSAYSTMEMDAVVFAFGSATGKTLSDFRREDLALAALCNVVLEVATDMVRLCIQRKVTNVVMCGGFSSDPFIRNLLEESFHRGLAGASVMEPGSAAEHATCKTFVIGSYLGALGGILQSLPTKEKPEA